MSDDKGKKARERREKKLFEGLKAVGGLDQGYQYDKFEQGYSQPKAQHELYSNMKSQGFYTKTFEEFQDFYFYDINNKQSTESPQPVDIIAEKKKDHITTSYDRPTAENKWWGWIKSIFFGKKCAICGCRHRTKDGGPTQ